MWCDATTKPQQPPKAIDIAIEASTEVVITAMVDLVKFLTTETVVITLDQFEKVTGYGCFDGVYTILMGSWVAAYGGGGGRGAMPLE